MTSTAFVFKAICLARRPLFFYSVVAVATFNRPAIRLTSCPPTVFGGCHFRVRQTAVILWTTSAISDVSLYSIILFASSHGPRAQLAPSPPTFFFIYSTLKPKHSFIQKFDNNIIHNLIIIQSINYISHTHYYLWIYIYMKIIIILGLYSYILIIIYYYIILYSPEEIAAYVCDVIMYSKTKHWQYRYDTNTMVINTISIKLLTVLLYYTNIISVSLNLF